MSKFMNRKVIAVIFALSAMFFINCMKDYDNSIDVNNDGSVPAIPQELKLFEVEGQAKVRGTFTYDFVNTLGITYERSQKDSNDFSIIDTVYDTTTFIDTAGLAFDTKYDYRICAFNANGNSGFTEIVSVTTSSAPDTSAPVITITSHSDSAVVFSDSVRLFGTVKDAESAVAGIYLNDPHTDTVKMLTDSTWYYDVLFEASEHQKMKELFFVVADELGNSRNFFWHLNWDTTLADTLPPEITVIEPAFDYYKTADSTVSFKLKIKDEQSGVLFVSINGLQVGADNDSLWSKSLSLNTVHNDTGKYEIIAADKSTLQNIDTLLFYVIYDSTLIEISDNNGPAIIIQQDTSTASVPESLTITVDTIALRGTVTDPAGVDSFGVTINSGSYIDLGVSGTWSKLFSFSSFTNVMTFAAKDSRGNDSMRVFTVYYDYSNSEPLLFHDTANGEIIWYWNKNSDIDFQAYTVRSSVNRKTTVADAPIDTIYTNIDTVYRESIVNGSEQWLMIGLLDSAGNELLSLPKAYSASEPAGMVLISSKDENFSMGQVGVAEHVHTVSFTYDFYMDSTEVSQKDYDALMSSADFGYSEYSTPDWTSQYGLGDNYPAYKIKWYEAVLYCNARSKMAGKDTVYSYSSIYVIQGEICGLNDLAIDYSVEGYRLPTDAEWEYACRAKSTTDFYWGNDTAVAGNYAAYLGNYDGGSKLVGERQPNGFGLYDMSGNMSEWINCDDINYDSTAVVDPKDDEITINSHTVATNMVSRSGNWLDKAIDLKSARRRTYDIRYGYVYVGFRTVLPVEIPTSWK